VPNVDSGVGIYSYFNAANAFEFRRTESCFNTTMSSGTLSSSPGPSTLQQNSKRALSANSRDAEDRLMKKSRTTSEEPSLTMREPNANSNSTAKDKKKRHKKKKRKVSVVVIEDGRARIKDSSHRGVSRALVPLTPPSPVKLGESSRSRSKSAVLANNEHGVEEAVHSAKVGFTSAPFILFYLLD
jgi:hypothetical protein